MNKAWQLNYLKQIEELIPSYCYISLKQNEDQLGSDATNFLILAAREYYLTGNIIQLLKKINGEREIQDLTQAILDDFIKLITNQNLIILVCNRIEILNKLDDTEHATDRATLGQLNKLLDRIKDKCPLSCYPLTPLKKLKIKAGTKSLYQVIANNKTEESKAEDIDIHDVKEALHRIRI